MNPKQSKWSWAVPFRVNEYTSLWFCSAKKLPSTSKVQHLCRWIIVLSTAFMQVEHVQRDHYYGFNMCTFETFLYSWDIPISGFSFKCRTYLWIEHCRKMCHLSIKILLSNRTPTLPTQNTSILFTDISATNSSLTTFQSCRNGSGCDFSTAPMTCRSPT